MNGTVGILNVGAGDIKLVFDPSNIQDQIRAARIVSDLLRRGYVLVVDSGRRDANDRPIFTRAYGFDEVKFEYIIADLQPAGDSEEIVRSRGEPSTEPSAASSGSAELEESAKAPKAAKGRPRKRVAASAVNAVAVPRSAGG